MLRRLVAFLLALVGALAIGTASTVTATTIASTAIFTYDAQPVASIDTREIAAGAAASPQVRGVRDGSGSPSGDVRRTSTTPVLASVATNTGGALKGAIPDAVPSNLTQQLALTEARASGGTQIMANLADNPRLVAVYGDGEWVKMQSVLRGTDVNTTVHWFKNLTTGLEVEFKFK